MFGPFQIALYRRADSSPTVREPFPVTFEAVYERLEALPRMFIEPDGSFVWVGEVLNKDGTSTAWQLDGHLYDRDDRLLFVELQGRCPRESLEELFVPLGVAPTEIEIEQRREGTTLGWEKFLERYK